MQPFRNEFVAGVLRVVLQGRSEISFTLQVKFSIQQAKQSLMQSISDLISSIKSSLDLNSSVSIWYTRKADEKARVCHCESQAPDQFSVCPHQHISQSCVISKAEARSCGSINPSFCLTSAMNNLVENGPFPIDPAPMVSKPTRSCNKYQERHRVEISIDPSVNLVFLSCFRFVHII